MEESQGDMLVNAEKKENRVWVSEKWLKEVEKYGTTQNKTKEDYVSWLEVARKEKSTERKSSKWKKARETYR